VLDLEEVQPEHGNRVGGKALQLAALGRLGLRTPSGFVVTTDAYARFVAEGQLGQVIRAELGRKNPADMRWEELWDAGLRLRRSFLATAIPAEIEASLIAALQSVGSERLLAVRSSALGEDGLARSFAGLHETVLDVSGLEELTAAIRIVWASLWSDAALLYRRELDLRVDSSRMAVLVQPMVEATPSGVAFGRDPRDPSADREVIEVVPGRCADLVDGRRDPERFVLAHSSGRLVSSRSGDQGATPLLDESDLRRLHEVLQVVERCCGWPPDMEWTGRMSQLTVLQARPITGGALADDERTGYLALKPSTRRLEELRVRVVEELIPALAAEGERLAEVGVETLDDAGLAAALEERAGALERWRRVYEEAFIPFAHGIRALGTRYNDLVRPEDPFEFLDLLAGEDLLAARRNAALGALALVVRARPELRATLTQALDDGTDWTALLRRLDATAGGPELVSQLEELAGVFDVAWEGVRLQDSPAQLLQCVVAAADRSGDAPSRDAAEVGERRERLEERLLEAAGPSRSAEVGRCLQTARLSWRIRDDDNLLLGRVESQLLRATREADRRLRDSERLSGAPANGEHAWDLAARLADPAAATLELAHPAAAERVECEASPGTTRQRQLSGQPAAPGFASGLARVILGPQDLTAFRPGEVLVCDAIQPQMTHLVPLASAVVERRGGMLIHGAIIARQLGLPCVNGVPAGTKRLRTGELLGVDCHLVVVTVGEAELNWGQRRQPGQS
jgi:pyruvate,water dikinase